MTELEKKQDELIEKLKGYTNLLKDAFDLLANNNLIKEDKRKLKITNEFSELVNKGAKLMSSSLQLESEIAALKQQGVPEVNDIKKLATDFFRHWWNTPGNNTDQGFDDWWKEHKKEYASHQGEPVTTKDLQDIDKAMEEKGLK